MAMVAPYQDSTAASCSASATVPTRKMGAWYQSSRRNTTPLATM